MRWYKKLTCKYHFTRSTTYTQMIKILTANDEVHAESIERCIENQAFSSSSDLAPPTSPPLLSHQQIVFLSQSSCVSPFELTDRGRGGRGWVRIQKI
jgi:hypothetical protein